MYARDICQIDKAFLKGRLQECVVNQDTGELIAITGDNGDMAEKIAQLMNIEATLPIQEPLGNDFKNVLHDNLHNLYQE